MSRPSRPLWVATLAYAAVLALMLVPMPHGSGEPAIPHLDKLVHFGLWFLLALATRPLFAARGRPGLAWTVLVPALFGVAVELIQGLTPARSADPFDALADLLGALAGTLAFELWRRRAPSTRRPSP